VSTTMTIIIYYTQFRRATAFDGRPGGFDFGLLRALSALAKYEWWYEPGGIYKRLNEVAVEVKARHGVR
jgi:hypothetical protein